MRLVSIGVVLLLAMSAAGGSARGAEPPRRVERLAEKGGASRPGRAAPLSFAADASAERVQAYRHEHPEQ